MRERDPLTSRERLAALVGRLQEQAEQERASLAHLLHDALGGQLAVARMTLTRAQRDAAATGDADLQATLAELEAQLAQVFEAKRRAEEQLRPALLDHFGLGVALPSLYEPACRDAGVGLVVNVARDLPVLAPDRAIVLYRVGESALVRMLRAGVRRVELQLDCVDGGCALGLRHDGADEGFDSAPEFNGYVLWVERLQGQWAIQRESPSGCYLRVTVPARPR
jgi:signal transduction histidine kinase